MNHNYDDEIREVLEEVATLSHTHGADYACPVCTAAHMQIKSIIEDAMVAYQKELLADYKKEIKEV